MDLENLQNDFKNNNYVKLTNMINLEDLTIIKNTLLKITDYSYDKKDITNNLSYYLYNEPCSKKILLKLLPFIESVVCKSLLPSYAIIRKYFRNSVLLKHVDREACEYSVSCMIAYSEHINWPIFIDKNDKHYPIILTPGDILVYKGQELPHWRNELSIDWYIQLFLHYVDIRGNYKDWVWDRRLFA